VKGRRRGRVENLKPWKKGQSGNINGRPKSAHLSKAYRAILEDVFPGDPAGRSWADVIAERLAKAAAKGDVQAAREMADRVEGRPGSTLEVNGRLGVRALPEGVSAEGARLIREDPVGFLAGEFARFIERELDVIIDRVLARPETRDRLRLLIAEAESKTNALLSPALPEIGTEGHRR
jgi:hypothetical protein